MDVLKEHTLSASIFIALGLGVFVRMIAKEKHRRDKNLLARLQAKAEAAEANGQSS
jgi:hypothetical protein